MTIRFQMTRERTGRHTGPRYRRVIDVAGLYGSAACAARSINMAMRYRDEQQPAHLSDEQRQFRTRIARLGMRVMALWARVFAGQIDQHDSRLDEANNAQERAVREYCHACEGRAA